MKKRLANVGLVVASLLLTILAFLGVTEIYFRVTTESTEPFPPAWNAFHPERGWALKPGEYSYFHFGAFRSVQARISPPGIRTSPLRSRPGPGERRVTVLGDSFVFSSALSDGEKFTDRLQELGEDQFEIVNASVPGYGTGQQILLLRELQEAGISPGDTIILVFFSNDVMDNVGLQYGSLEPDPRKPTFRIGEDGELRLEPPQPPSSASGSESRATWLASVRWRLQNLFGVAFVKSRLETLLVASPALMDTLGAVGLAPELPRVPGIVAGWYGPRWREHWNVTADLLRYLTDRAPVEFGAELSVVYIPSPFQVSAVHQRMVASQADRDPRFDEFLRELDRPGRVLGDLCREVGIPFVDLTPTLRDASHDQVVFFPREGHLTAAGSRVVATGIFEGLPEFRNARSRAEDRRP